MPGIGGNPEGSQDVGAVPQTIGYTPAVAGGCVHATRITLALLR